MISFWTFCDWLFYGLIRAVLVWAPVVAAPRVERSIPSQWWSYNTWYDWYGHLDANDRPDEHWCRQWLEMTFGEFSAMIEGAAEDAWSAAIGVVRSLLGALRAGYSSFSHWIDVLHTKLGGILPYWTDSVVSGLGKLWTLIPVEIRVGLKSWTDWANGIAESVRQWVRDTYDYFASLANSAWNWVLSQGDRLRHWVDSVSGWIDGFKRDPYGTVTSWLGSAWVFLVAFFTAPVGYVLSWLGSDWSTLVDFRWGPLTWLSNLWSFYADLISEFCADPKSFIVDRLERAILDRW